MSVEQTIEDMFDCQQQVIAKVSLRGYRFQSVDTVRRIGVGYRNGKWHKGESVYCRLYELIDPDGKTWGNFEDVYSAALAAERLMVERGEIAPFEYEAGQLARRYIEPDAFKLKPENEQ